MDGSYTNQGVLLETVFSAYIQSAEDGGKDVYFDPGQANKWFNGLMKISTDICQYYCTSPAHQKELAITLEDTILPYLSDPAMTVQRVYELLVQDASVSENKKRELFDRRAEGNSVFLAAVLVFGMGRPFEARNIRKPEKNQNSAKSPSVQDYIFDAEPPKPCRGFCGRDAELTALHEALEATVERIAQMTSFFHDLICLSSLFTG